MRELITALLVNLIPDLYSSGIKKFKDVEFKTEEELGIIYINYLEFEYKRYSQIKTLLYKNEPKNLYNFYEHVNLKKESGETFNTEDSNNIFKGSKKVLITGTGGIGKSLLMKHIFIDQIKRSSSIPIFIELKNVNQHTIDSLVLEDYIYETVLNHHLEIDKDSFSYTMEKGVYTFILDGFDEVHYSHQDKIQTEIKNVSDKYMNNQFIVSSRPSDFFIGWNDFEEYDIQKLSKKQALSLIKKLEYDEKTKSLFYKDLNLKLYQSHEAFASIPLLLTIMLLTYEMGATIPEDLTEFYNQAFYALYQKHDASKSGYRRELKAQLSPEDFKDHLAYIGMQTFFSTKVTFTISEMNQYLKRYKDKNGVDFNNHDFLVDVTKSACMLFLEGDVLRFTHRSFQEYFAGVGITKLKDELQRKILVSWSESDRNNIQHNKAFISTILKLQKEHTYNNLFVPLIEKMEECYESVDNDVEKLIPLVFNTFSVTKFSKEDDKDLEDKISFNLKEKYSAYFAIHFLVFQSTKVDYQSVDIDMGKDRETLIQYLLETNMRTKYEQIQETEFKSLIIKYINCWFIPRLEFMINWKNEVKERSNTRKRNYLSILDEI